MSQLLPGGIVDGSSRDYLADHYTPQAQKIKEVEPYKVMPLHYPNPDANGGEFIRTFSGAGGALKATLLLLAGRVPLTMNRFVNVLNEINPDFVEYYASTGSRLEAAARQMINTQLPDDVIQWQDENNLTLQYRVPAGETVITANQGKTYTLEEQGSREGIEYTNANVLAGAIAYAQFSSEFFHMFGVEPHNIFGKKFSIQQVKRSYPIFLLEKIVELQTSNPGTGLIINELEDESINLKVSGLYKTIENLLTTKLNFGGEQIQLVNYIKEGNEVHFPTQELLNHADALEKVAQGDYAIVLIHQRETNEPSKRIIDVITQLVEEKYKDGRAIINTEDVLEIVKKDFPDISKSDVALALANCSSLKDSEVYEHDGRSGVNHTHFTFYKKIVTRVWGEDFITRGEYGLGDFHSEFIRRIAQRYKEIGESKGTGLSIKELEKIGLEINDEFSTGFSPESVRVKVHRYANSHFTSKGTHKALLSVDRKQLGLIQEILNTWNRALQTYQDIINNKPVIVEDESGEFHKVNGYDLLSEAFEGVDSENQILSPHPLIKLLVYRLTEGIRSRSD